MERPGVPGMGRECLLWMLLTAGDLATLGLPGPWLPPRLPPPPPPPPPELLTGPEEAGEPFRFFPSRPKEAPPVVEVEVVVVLPCCWDCGPAAASPLLWWTKGPSESVESLLFITTLMRLMDSAGLAEGGPRPGGSCLRLRLRPGPGVQFTPTV